MHELIHIIFNVRINLLYTLNNLRHNGEKIDVTFRYRKYRQGKYMSIFLIKTSSRTSKEDEFGYTEKQQ